MVFGVCFEMGCQLVDASCEQSHLDFGATRVIGSASIGLDDLSLDRGSPTLVRKRPFTRDQRSCSVFVIAFVLFQI